MSIVREETSWPRWNRNFICSTADAPSLHLAEIGFHGSTCLLEILDGCQVRTGRAPSFPSIPRQSWQRSRQPQMCKRPCLMGIDSNPGLPDVPRLGQPGARAVDCSPRSAASRCLSRFNALRCNPSCPAQAWRLCFAKGAKYRLRKICEPQGFRVGC